MLPSQPEPLRNALNRLTFGARQSDMQIVNSQGLASWLTDQFNVPNGDDPDLAAFIAGQIMHIEYAAPQPNDTRGTWSALSEDRPLNYLNAPTQLLFTIARLTGTTYSGQERTRIRQELLAATWIRNAHSRFQLREFMVDFWHNHFNIGKNENDIATALLPLYDREAIRPHAFGNFRNMLEANATSPSMLIYLDNWVSTTSTPNENYAREIMELHTLGGGNYLGVDLTSATYTFGPDGVRSGFTDQDVIQGSRALSGWTIQYGQRFSGFTQPLTGAFTYSASQHNTRAGSILGIDVSRLTGDMEQGRRFIDIIAYHPGTATFVVTKLCRRIFGDSPPQAVIDRGVTAWLDNKTAPDQIRKVLEAIVLGGPEIYSGERVKVRRPYERLIALARTTDIVVNAATTMTTILDSMNDGLFAWPAPNGRPDVNAYWLATGANLTTWNLLLQFPAWASNRTTLLDQTPMDGLVSAVPLVEYWVGRMVGYTLASTTMNALINDQGGNQGVLAAVRNGMTTATQIARVETALRRLVSMIATTEEFAYR